MTLDEACSKFEALFGAAKSVPKADRLTTVLCSGALGLPGHPPPVLCATAALAIELWWRTARDHAEEHGSADSHAKSTLLWVSEPKLLRFVMTIQEGQGGHRVASSRYAVYSLCAIEGAPQDVDGEAIQECLTTTTPDLSQPTAEKPKAVSNTAKSRRPAETTSEKLPIS